MSVRGLIWGGLLWLSTVSLCEAQAQTGEQVLAADKGSVGTPLRRPDTAPQYQLSNLRKGGGSGLRPAEFSLDFVRNNDGVGPFTVILVANGVNGRKEYSSWGPFSPFRDKSGTVTAEGSFSPFRKNLGDQFEIWMEAQAVFENKSYRFKISNSVVLGNVGQLTLAREWSADEKLGVERWRKSVTPPPAPPAGHIAVVAETKLVAGMPILAGWMSAWEPAEVIDVRKDGMILVKYKPEMSATMIVRPRTWVAVASTVLQTAASDPAKFKPSIRVVPNGTTPIADDLVPLAKDVKLLKGVPLQMEFVNKWVPVTVVKELVDGRVRIHWDEWKGHADEDKPREVLLISKETLTAMKEPGAAEKFAERATESTGTFEGAQAAGPRQLKDYPIRLPIPKNAVKVTEDMALEEGTKLGCSWGQSWHDVTVLDVYEDGNLRIHWDKFGDAWDGDISRSCLVIDKRVLVKLPKKEPTATKETKGKDAAATDPPKTATEGDFQVVLKGAGKNKFAVIKVVMEITGLEIKDAKELVENLPIPLKGGIRKADAEKLLKKITTAGGTGEVNAP